MAPTLLANSRSSAVGLPFVTSPSTRRLRTLTWGAVPLTVMGLALSVDRIPGTEIRLTVPYAAEGPGPVVDTLGDKSGTAVVDVVSHDPKLKVEDPSGELNMTTVSVRTNMTLPQVISRWATTDDTIVPLEKIIPQDKTEEEVTEANEQAFAQSESAATIAAMDYLNLPVKVQVAGVLEESPAAGHFEENDILRAVAGTKVDTPQQAQELIGQMAPGDHVELTIERDGKERKEDIVLGKNPHDPKAPLLGIFMISVPAEDVEVSYNLQDIGGPSAGMMFTLAVIDKLSAGDLTGGTKVAGTGTIAEDGTVGPIGGIVHKVRAARDAGMQLFLAPADNCKEAMSRDTGDMVVAKVETLDDAVKAMDDFAAGKPVERCS